MSSIVPALVLVAMFADAEAAEAPVELPDPAAYVDRVCKAESTPEATAARFLLERRVTFPREWVWRPRHFDFGLMYGPK